MMELNLSRIDYFQVGITSQKCMSIIPGKPKQQNKIAIADRNGVLQIIGIKRAEPIIVFKTLPSTAINRLALGGPCGKESDRIFVTSGNKITAYSKKGKQFLNFETNLTEEIKSLYVDGSDLFMCGTYTYNHFRDCKDRHYYLCPDKINDVIALHSENPVEGEDPLAILACQDRVLRVIHKSELLYEINVEGPVETLMLHQGGQTQQQDTSKDSGLIVYGTSNGLISMLRLQSDDYSIVWCIDNNSHQSGINCMSYFDITGDGNLDLLIGRDDGQVQVYLMPEEYQTTDSDLHGGGDGSLVMGETQPTLKHSLTLNESITSIQGGCLGTAGYDEIICMTYAGWLIGLTTESQNKSVGPDRTIETSDINLKKIDNLRKEVDNLSTEITGARDRYQSHAGSKTAVSAAPQFNVNARFTLNAVDANYTLSIEVQTAIDNILLQCDVPVDLLDVEKNSAVVSHSSFKTEEGNYLLATYRCQANTTRIELKIRSIEGQYGTLQCYVTPRLTPKTCQLCTFQIKAMSLHQRCHDFDESRPLNTLTLKGQFSVAELHSWLTFALPEMPERPPHTSEEDVTFNFISTFLGTQLQCKYRKGEANIRTENISTISILKDVLTKEATKKKKRLDISFDINPKSVVYTLKLIHPKLGHLLRLAKEVQLIDALKELEIHEPDLSFLSSEYRDILDNVDKLQRDNKCQPCHLERVYGMLTDLYIDKFKFLGMNVKNKIPALLNVLDNYQLDSLIEFFDE